MYGICQHDEPPMIEYIGLKFESEEEAQKEVSARNAHEEKEGWGTRWEVREIV